MNIEKSARWFEEFTGHEATEATRYPLPKKDIAGAVMGPVWTIGYTATKDGETARFLHDFAEEAAPLLIAGEDGNLYTVGGNYRLNDHGIVDNMGIVAINPHKRGQKKERATVATRRKRKHGRRGKKARAGIMTILANPSGRRKRRSGRRHVAAPRGRTKIIVRRNPSGRGLDWMDLALGSAVSAGGAIAASIVTAVLPIPAEYKTGKAGTAIKVIAGIAGGMVLSKFAGKKLGQNFAQGAMTIAMVDFVKTLIPTGIPMAGFIPNPGFNGFIPDPGFNGADDGMWIDGNTGRPLSASEMANMGAYTPAMVYPDSGDAGWINR